VGKGNEITSWLLSAVQLLVYNNVRNQVVITASLHCKRALIGPMFFTYPHIRRLAQNWKWMVLLTSSNLFNLNVTV